MVAMRFGVVSRIWSWFRSPTVVRQSGYRRGSVGVGAGFSMAFKRAHFVGIGAPGARSHRRFGFGAL